MSQDLLTRAEAAGRAVRIAGTVYDLSLWFTSRGEGFRGECRISFDLKDSRGDLRLDLVCGTVDSLELNGKSLPAEAVLSDRIMLPASVLQTGQNRVSVRYSSSFDSAALGVRRLRDPADGEDYLYTDFQPFGAHRLLPCFDQPDLKGVLRLAVTAPEDWEVVGNTAQTSSLTVPEGVRREFDPTPPIATALFFAGAGPYQVFVDTDAEIPSRILCRQSRVSNLPLQELQDLTRRGFRFFQDYFGMPYPFGKYDQLFVPELDGAMENVGAVTLMDDFLYRYRPSKRERQTRAETLLHEMAHMWFGNLVTMKWWDDLWLNESFATYVSYLALSRMPGYEDAFDEFLSELKADAYRADQLSTTHPISGAVEDTDMAFGSFDGITYGKGAAALKQLSYRIGHRAFRDGVRTYLERHAWGNTVLEDFLSALGHASGYDLAPWAGSHLRTSGVNTVKVSIQSSSGRVDRLELSQSRGNGDASLRPHRVEVAMYGCRRGGDDPELGTPDVISVLLEGESTIVEEAIGFPEPRFLWPNHGDHGYLRVFLDPGSLDWVKDNLCRLPDGLTRRGVWMSLWEMVQDGSLKPGSFLEVVRAQAPLERDARMLPEMIGNAARCVAHYLPSQTKASWNEALFWLGRKALETADAGSDAEREWMLCVIKSAATPDDLEWLQDWLAADGQLSALQDDASVRWKAVVHLAARGCRASEAVITREVQRDPSDLGRKQALCAQASMPRLQVKRSFWTRFLEDEKASLDALRTAMDGFHRRSQQDLSRQFVAPYFQELPRIVASRDLTYASTFARVLFPHAAHDPLVLDQTRDHLEENQHYSPEVRRVLQEAQDDLERCLSLTGKRPAV